DRGRRLSEQVELMRLLWTSASVTFDGRHEHVTGAGIAPMPLQRPIPVWIGGGVDAALRRAGRIADGWFPQHQPGPKLDRALSIVRDAASESGRDPAGLGMEGRVRVAAGPSGVSAAVERVHEWSAAGATHVGLNTMGAGFTSVDEHIEALAAVASELRLSD